MQLKSDGTFPDETYLTTTLGWWNDASHPNDKGHIWIAERVLEYFNIERIDYENEKYRYDTSNNQSGGETKRLPFDWGALSSAPSRPVTNDRYLDISATPVEKYFNGSAWVNL